MTPIGMWNILHVEMTRKCIGIVAVTCDSRGYAPHFNTTGSSLHNIIFPCTLLPSNLIYSDKVLDGLTQSSLISWYKPCSILVRHSHQTSRIGVPADWVIINVVVLLNLE